MLRKLSKSNATTWYYKDGARVPGHPPGVRGDLTGVSGDLSDVWGDLTGVSGDLDDCAITQSDRYRGIDISELLADAAESETE